MKGKIYITILSALSLFTACKEGARVDKPSLGMSISTDTDKFARLNFEKRKLVNPETGKIPEGIRAKELAFKNSLKSALQDTSNVDVIAWQERGPFNVGGRTRAFAQDLQDENVLIAGGVSGGIWRSTDNGQSWEIRTGADQNISVTCIAQDSRPGLQDIWYYGTGEGYGSSQSATGAYFLGNGLYKSVDNGLTWESIDATSSDTPNSFDSYWDIVWNVQTDQSVDTSDVLYAAILGRVMKSNDGGDSWTSMIGSSSSNYCYFTDVMVLPNGVAYATMSSDGPSNEKGIWRADPGQNFVNITPDNYPATYDRTVMAYNPDNLNEVSFLAVTANEGKVSYNWQGEPEYHTLWKYTYVSGDGSDNTNVWTDLSENIPVGPDQFDDYSAQGGYDMCIAYQSGTSNIIIGGTNLYISTSAFEDSLNTNHIGGYGVGTFLPDFKMYWNHHPDQHFAFYSSHNTNRLYSACDGGVYYTDDATADTVNWVSLNNGYVTTQFYHVAVDQSTNNSEVIGGLQDNGTQFVRTNAFDSEWTMPLSYDGGFTAIEDGGTHYYMATQSGKMVKGQIGQDGLLSSYRRIDPAGASDYLFINPFELDPSDQNIIYTLEGNKVWRNNDLNNISLDGSWDTLSQGWFVIGDSIPNSGYIYTSLSVSNNHTLYMGTDSRKVFKITDANGVSPQLEEITSGTPILFPNAYVNCVAVDPNNEDHALVVFSNYGVYSIYSTNDGGANWEKSAGNLEQFNSGGGNGPSVRWISILPLSDGKIYFAGTSVGLFATDTLMGEETIWSPVAENSIGNAVVEMIEVRPLDGLVVVATHGKGVFSANISSVNVVAGNKELTNIEFNLYPSPSKDYVVVETNGLIKELYLYDLNGKLVKVISISGMKTELSVADLSKGVYILKDELGMLIKKFVKN